VAARYWPLEQGRIVTSPYAERAGGFHFGVDFGFPGGSGGRTVYAVQSGTVLYSGAAQGYGGPDPAGWLVIDSDNDQGGGVFEYGHIVRRPEIRAGSRVTAGQPLAVINPDSTTNGGTAPHLHLSYMPGGYDAANKIDPLPVLAGALEVGKEKVVGKPDFNEYWVGSPNNQPRGNTKIDLVLLHTQEGPGNADSLAQFLANPANQVSYHYTVSQDPRDQGVTVCDVVDTDLASWSVLSANNRSINICFAGSSVSWTREQWMGQSKAIDAAAWLAVQDCKKYGIPTTVVAPPYTSGRPGISDHAYVTRILRDGSHSDTGPNFPWTYFAQKVAEYATPETPTAPTPKPPVTTPKPPAKQYPRDYTDRELLEDIWRRVFKLTQP
jgi:N-acetyl-anhydromuramyl-L-alanine amidase AmpD